MILLEGCLFVWHLIESSRGSIKKEEIYFQLTLDIYWADENKNIK